VDDDARLTAEQLADVPRRCQDVQPDLYAAASAGDGRAALGALEQHRLLCAHRAGPRGVQHWSDAAATWSAEVHDVVARADGHYWASRCSSRATTTTSTCTTATRVSWWTTAAEG
jgi:exodeoxyribonuclease V alpha subunit